MPPEETGPRPKAGLNSLEVDQTGAEEYRARQADLQRERAQKTGGLLAKAETQQDLTFRAMREAEAAKTDWRKIKWGFLRLLLFFLATCYALTAFYDPVNFRDGLQILKGGFKQLLVLAAIYGAAYALRRRMTEEQAQKVGDHSKGLSLLLGGGIALYVLVLGTKGIADIAVQRGPHGAQWNRSFVYFLVVLAAETAACRWLLKVRRWVKDKLEAQEHSFGDDSVPALSRRRLQTVQFVCEGLIFNLGLMAFFQFAYNVDVPLAVVRALARPAVFLFYFFPFFSYVTIRKFLANY